MQRRALAQIPLILGLLVMAIAIPVATKLVQENQDSRRSAASCGTSGTVSQCGTKGGCSTGYRCISRGVGQGFNCSYDPSCGGFVPTDTPPNECSGNATRCNGIQLQRCQNGNWVMVENCAYGCSNGACKAAPTATRTPTAVPTATPPPAEMCPQAQKCGGSNVLHDCKNKDADGTTRDVVCNVAGKLDTCGGKNYCCPTAGGNWTTDMAKCPRSNEMCPQAQQCGGSNVLHDCKNKDADGTTRDVVCNVTGKVDTCGGTDYCCPTAGGNWTTDMTRCPAESERCPGAQACPGSTGKVLHDCQYPDADGTTKDTVCTTTGQRATCGGKYYCCPTAGGNWTTDMTKCPSTCGNAGTVSQCGTKGGCSTGYRCISRGVGQGFNCSYDPSCGGFVPTSTPEPEECATPGAVRCKGIQVQTCRNNVWVTGETCLYACSDGRCKPKPTTTLTITSAPTQVPIVVTRVPTQSPSDKCPGAQACPDSTGKILRDCVKPDNDGTSRDSICAVAGEKDTCGGKDYCCPTAGGKWTTDMTKCPAANCTQCTNDPGAKGKGDADCSRFTNLTDYLIWKEEYIAGDLGASVKNTWRADFNCDGKVDLVNDYLIWKNYYITTLQ